MKRFRAQADCATAALPRIQGDPPAVADFIEHSKRERRLMAGLQEGGQGNAARFVHWRGPLPAGSATSNHAAMSC
jgi:hypothetical protein